MGEMADELIDMIFGNEDALEVDHSVRCKFCGRYFYWCGDTGSSFHLVTASGVRHVCDAMLQQRIASVDEFPDMT